MNLQRLKHFLFVPSRPFEVTSPVYYCLKNPSQWNIFGWKPLATLVYAFPALRRKLTRRDTNERIIEVPWIFSKLNFSQKGKILDVGWLESTISLSLATAGFSVTGIDIRKGDIEHPNITARVEDICCTTLRENTFDTVILLSTLEHIGLESMYGSVDKKSSDQKAILSCLRVLKPGGKLLITTPVGAIASRNNFMRVYTPSSLRKILRTAQIDSMTFFVPNDDRTLWREVNEKELVHVTGFGVALISARKRNSS